MRTRSPWWRLLAGGAVAAFGSALLAGASAASAATPAAGARAAGGTWGTAKEVPGLAALNKGGHALVSSVSCPSAGNCGAAGLYTDGADRGQLFVVSQTNGTWGKAIEVPGMAALNREDAGFITLSCASPGNCSVGGSYVDRHLAGQAFVANQVHGTWGKAIEVPGTAALNTGGEAGMESVSCAAPGRCSAGGFYGDSHGNLHGFVVSET